jgi:RHS repeat-associated protein
VANAQLLQDLSFPRLFEEPLIPIGTHPTAEERGALATALQSHARRTSPDDFSSLTAFLDEHPGSPWSAALLLNLGLEYYNTGHYSLTLDAWRGAWELATASSDAAGKAIADRAVGELATMYARLGRMSELEALLGLIEDRVLAGPATERIAGAREGLVTMKTRPEIAFRCGPLALHRIKLALDPANPGTDAILAAASSHRGCSLRQVAELSATLGLGFQMAFRDPRAPFAVPSVVHLKVDHYAALVRRDGDRYLLQDPTFGNDVWMTEAALEAESSGYVLVSPGALPAGHRAVAGDEGDTVWGKGNTTGSDPTAHGPCDPHTGGGGACNGKAGCGDDGGARGMAVPRVHLMLVSLNINDEPIGYQPPVGPAVRFSVRYNQREAFQPSTFTYSNLGPKWTFDWLSYITDQPASPSADVAYYIMGGGTRRFTGFDPRTQAFQHQQVEQTRLVRTSPSSYEMVMRDGARRIFSHPDGSVGSSRKIFLTQVIDPSGNAVSLTYDGDLRLVTITDAIGQVTTVWYEHATDHHKITRVTDPFGRAASFEYDGPGRLIRITDVIGIASQLTYDQGDFVTALTTPYGITHFSKSEDGTTRSLEIAHPDGSRERVEYNQSPSTGIPHSDPPETVPAGMATTNQYLGYRNTFYWDRQGCAHGYGDHRKARIYHWLHTSDMASTAGILESVKAPLEGRVWYAYAGQSSSIVVGSSNRPTHEGRVLDDGSTQLYTRDYNAFGNLTREVDPVGRTVSYVYADNGIDLVEIRQTRAGQNQLLARRTYDARHQMLTATDAAAQTTTFTYDARGQILSSTNARGEVTTYGYDAGGYLTSITGALPGARTVQTYDAMGRIRSWSDGDEPPTQMEYDGLDRVIKISHGDGTYEELAYTHLDRTSMRDRAGRITRFEYNSSRQQTRRIDPLGRETRFQWCHCGDLRSLTDPMGRTTTWRHDVQGRVKAKEYCDGSRITYQHELTTSRLRQRIDEKLQVTHYHYNSDDTLRRVHYTNAAVATADVTFTYDPDFNRTASMTDGTGTTRYRYAPITPVPTLAAGRLVSVEGPAPDQRIDVAYDELGRRVSITSGGESSTSTFDALGRLARDQNALGVFEYSYHGGSKRRAAQVSPNGLVTTYEHAGAQHGHVLRRITDTIASARISEHVYEYDASRRISSWSQQLGMESPQVHTPGYDAAGRVTSVAVSDGGGAVTTFGYRYDAVSNRLTETVDASERRFSYNALNQLTSVSPDGAVPARFDWDAEHRLVAVERGDQVARLTYDGLGRCVVIRTLVSGAEVSSRRLVWDGDRVFEERTATGAISKRFYDQGMRVEGGADAGAYYYTRDHLGSIRGLIDSTGRVRGSYQYDPFGRARRVDGDLAASFGFAGMLSAGEVGLALTRYRAYDPELGRWLTRDPLSRAEVSQGPNLYAYVDNDPLNRIDPLGLACCVGEWYGVMGATLGLVGGCVAAGAASFTGIGLIVGGLGCLALVYGYLAAREAYEECMKKCPAPAGGGPQKC